MDAVKRRAKKAYAALDGIFSDREAWGLFRLAAFAETFGWTCLIIAIITVKLEVPYADNYIAVGGSVHGLLYLFYFFIVIFAHRSLKWSILRFIVAQIVAVIPYGALVFEFWVALRRKHGKI